MLKDESGVFPKSLLVFGGGEVVERGADEASAVFADGGLPRLQFVAQRQQLLHLRHNPPLFGKRREWKCLVLKFLILEALNGHPAFHEFFENVGFVSTEHQPDKRTQSRHERHNDL